MRILASLLAALLAGCSSTPAAPESAAEVNFSIGFMPPPDDFAFEATYTFAADRDLAALGYTISWALVDSTGTVTQRSTGPEWTVTLDARSYRVWAAAFSDGEQRGAASTSPQRLLQLSFQHECLPVATENAPETCEAISFDVPADVDSVRIAACTDDVSDSEGYVDVFDGAGDFVGNLEDSDVVECSTGARPWDGSFSGAAGGEWSAQWLPSLGVGGAFVGLVTMSLPGLPLGEQPDFSATAPA